MSWPTRCPCKCLLEKHFLRRLYGQRALSKRFLLFDGISTVPFGHKAAEENAFLEDIYMGFFMPARVLIMGSFRELNPFLFSRVSVRSTTLSWRLILTPQLLGHTWSMWPNVSLLPQASQDASCPLCHLWIRPLVGIGFPLIFITSMNVEPVIKSVPFVRTEWPPHFLVWGPSSSSSFSSTIFAISFASWSNSGLRLKPLKLSTVLPGKAFVSRRSFSIAVKLLSILFSSLTTNAISSTFQRAFERKVDGSLLLHYSSGWARFICCPNPILPLKGPLPHTQHTFEPLLLGCS